MATPKPSYGYGVALPQSSPTVTQPQAPSNMAGLLGGLFGGPQQGNLDALLKLLKANQQNPGFMGGRPPQAPQQIPPYSPNIDDMGEPDVNFRPGNPQDHIMPPGFVAQPVPMPPRLPEGRPIGGVPPYMPNPMESGYYTNPNQPPSGTAMPPQSQYGVPTSSDGKWLFNNGQWMPNSTAKTFPMPESRPEEVFPGPGKQPQPQQGTNMRSLFDALRAMQGRTTAPQAPLVPERTMPIQYDETPLPANVPMSDEQRKRMLEAFMSVSPRMPSPTPVPQTQMGGRSAMGLSGLLSALRASRQR